MKAMPLRGAATLLLRFLAYSSVTLVTVAAPGHSLATGVLITALSGLADSLLRRLPLNLK